MRRFASRMGQEATHRAFVALYRLMLARQKRRQRIWRRVRPEGGAARRWREPAVGGADARRQTAEETDARRRRASPESQQPSSEGKESDEEGEGRGTPSVPATTADTATWTSASAGRSGDDAEDAAFLPLQLQPEGRGSSARGRRALQPPPRPPSSSGAGEEEEAALRRLLPLLMGLLPPPSAEESPSPSDASGGVASKGMEAAASAAPAAPSAGSIPGAAVLGPCECAHIVIVLGLACKAGALGTSPAGPGGTRGQAGPSSPGQQAVTPVPGAGARRGRPSSPPPHLDISAARDVADALAASVVPQVGTPPHITPH